MVLEYTPRMRGDLTPARWLVIREFVIDAASTLGLYGVDRSRDLLGILARYVAWCVGTAAMKLVPAVIFHPSAIARYVSDENRAEAETTRQAREHAIRSAALGLGVGDGERVLSRQNRASQPYTRADLPALFAFTNSQRRPEVRRAGLAILAFSGGAGLNSSELARLRLEDIERAPEGTLVHVSGSHPRVVPMSTEWETVSVRAIDPKATGGFALLPDVTSTAENYDRRHQYVTHYAPGPRDRSAVPKASRLRAMWIAARMNSVPMETLARYAGLNTGSLAAFARFAVPMSHGDAMSILCQPGVTP